MICRAMESLARMKSRDCRRSARRRQVNTGYRRPSSGRCEQRRARVRDAHGRPIEGLCASDALDPVDAPQATQHSRQMRTAAHGDDEAHFDRFAAGTIRHLRSEEHTSELQSLMRISYAVFCLKKKKTKH